MIIISFAMTTAALRAERKSVTRREWTDEYAERVKRSLEKSGGLAQAWSASPHRKGEKVGIVRVLSIEKEKTCEIPDSDWEAEGFAYMVEKGLNLGKNLTCEKLWRLWRQDPEKKAYTIRFEITELLCQCCEEPIPIPDDGRWEAGGYQVVCWECYRDEYSFECCCCGETADIQEQGAIGNLLVAVGKEDEDGKTEAGVPAGLYRITGHPYYMQSMVGAGWLFETEIERVGDVPRGIDTDGYPAGHFCSECSRKHSPAEPKAVAA